MRNHTRRFLLAGLAIVSVAGCRAGVNTPAASSPRPAVASTTHPAWTRTATIYEVNVRQYTPEGTLAAFEKHLPRLKDLGVDILWLMPVQPIGREARKGSLGSYYSVSDYTAINPEFGTENDFRSLVRSAHALGLRVILDWVPNHTAFDHEWTRGNRDFYTLRPDGSISVARDNSGKETDWTDVADLNYDNRQMRQAQIHEMLWWVERMGIDGFRMDVAWGVPYDFWAEASRVLRNARSDLFLLAEAEDPNLHQWFDMTYGWELHHVVNEIAQGKKGFPVLRAYWAKQDSLYPPDAYRMHFTSNHDENSWQGTEFERMGANHLPAFVFMATARNGMPLMYTGQEVSLNKRLRFFEKDTVDWNGPSLVPFYKAMLQLKHTQPALANGAGGAQRELPHQGGDRVYAFTRTSGSNTVLVAVNFAASPVRVNYRDLATPGAYTDWFSKAAVQLGSSGTLEIPANGWRVLVK